MNTNPTYAQETGEIVIDFEVITRDKQIWLEGNVVILVKGQTTIVYNVPLTITLEDPIGKTIETFETKTKSMDDVTDFTDPTLSLPILDLGTKPMPGDYVTRVISKGEGVFESAEGEFIITVDAPPTASGGLILHVTDTNGEPVEGALIQIMGNEMTTDNEGVASFDALPIGSFDYTITMQGYQSVSGSDTLTKYEKTIEIQLYQLVDQETSIISASYEEELLGDTERGIQAGESREVTVMLKDADDDSAIIGENVWILINRPSGSWYEEQAVTDEFGTAVLSIVFDTSGELSCKAYWYGNSEYMSDEYLFTVHVESTNPFIPAFPIESIVLGLILLSLIRRVRSAQIFS